MKQRSLPNGVVTSALETINPKNHGVVPLGPEVYLVRGRVHEVQGDSAESFAMAAGSAMDGPVFWIGLREDVEALSPLGVDDYFDPARLVMTTGVSRLEVLWAGEQALRTEGIACVVIELRSGPDLRESRRLQIAAEESGALGLILIKGRAYTSAAHSRWQCDAIKDDASSWRWVCTKNRKGQSKAWRVNWRGNGNGPGVIHMAAATAA